MLELISVRGSKSAEGNWTDMYLPWLESHIRPPKKLYLTHPNHPILGLKHIFFKVRVNKFSRERCGPDCRLFCDRLSLHLSVSATTNK